MQSDPSMQSLTYTHQHTKHNTTWNLYITRLCTWETYFTDIEKFLLDYQNDLRNTYNTTIQSVLVFVLDVSAAEFTNS